MKTNKFLQFLTMAFCAVAFAFVTGCEGPEGPQGPAGTAGADGADGQDGADGVDANETCKQCHNDETTVINAVMTQFEEGAHSVGTYYDRDGQCAACHNNEGFRARIDYTAVDDIDAFVGAASPISCYTCHGIHESYTTDDWMLTNANQVTDPILGFYSPDYDQVALLDIGNSNMCLQCHQSRDRGNVPGPETAADGEITSTHWGPHYGVQGSVLNAVGGVNVAGSASYPDQGAGAHAGLDNACITCHMPEANHNLEVDYATCATTGCHPTEDAAEDLQEALHDEILADRLALGALLEAQGVMAVDEVDEDGVTPLSYEPVVGAATAAQMRGVWNYMVVYQDHSYGLHNPTYIRALLANSIEEVTP